MMRYLITIAMVMLTQIASSQSLKTVTGRVVDEQTGEKIPFATVWVEKSEISVVSNGDGNFSIKVPTATDSIWVKQLGYQEQAFKVTDRNMTVRLRNVPIVIDGVIVRTGNPILLLTAALRKVNENYSRNPMNLISFYREMTRRNGRYVAVAEAITEIYKAPITNYNDQARLYKGRRSSDYSRVDTLIMRYQGGVSTAMVLDIAKNNLSVFGDTDSIAYYYVAELAGTTELQGRAQYIINFGQRPSVKDMLFRGTIWIDVESLAISRCEFARNVEDNPLAYREFVRRIPSMYRMKMLSANYVMDYIYDGTMWNYNYSKAEIDMRLISTKRKFTANYSITSELVVTDRSKDNVHKFKSDERLKSTEMVFDRVVEYKDDEFWEGFNVIEPEQSLEQAVKRINRKIEIN